MLAITFSITSVLALCLCIGAPVHVSLLYRRAGVFSVTFRVIAAAAFLAVRARLFSWSEATHQEYTNVNHSFYARRVAEVAKTNGGLWVKLGQYLSGRGDVLPPEWTAELKVLQDSIPACPAAVVRATVEEDLGGAIDTLFAWFEAEPVASASIAQVHKAQLLDGTLVAVKVQHENIGLKMAQDLADLLVISWLVMVCFRTVDISNIVQEYKTEISKELSFVHEAYNLKRTRQHVQRAGIDVIIPRSIEGMGSTRVLVMSWEEGFKIDDLDEFKSQQIDVEELLVRLCQAFGQQVFRDGCFNCDPHPGNLLVSCINGVARPVLLDFGMVKDLSDKVRHSMAKVVFSAASLDIGGLLEAVAELGFHGADEDSLMETIRFAMRQSAPAAEMRAKAKEFMKDRKAKRLEEARKKLQQEEAAQAQIAALPGEIAMLFRVIMLLRGLCSTLGARVDYLSILASYAQLALIDRIPSQLHSASFAAGTVGSHLEQELLKVILENHPQVLGMQVSVYQHGKPVAEICAGVVSEIDARSVQPDTLFNVFSVTKAVIAAVVHTMIDRGELQLDSLIVDHWHEFAPAGSSKARCTVAHALAHRAGLHNAVNMQTDVKSLCNFDAMIRKIEQAEPENDPGEEYHYHYLSYGWLLGGLVQKVLHQPLAKVVRARLIDPLQNESEFYMCTGMSAETVQADAKIAQLSLGFFGASDGSSDMPSASQMMSKMAEMQKKTPAPDSSAAPSPQVPLSPLSFNMQRVRKANIPAANGHCSARALAKFYATLASGLASCEWVRIRFENGFAAGGVMNGQRIFSTDAIASMHTPVQQTPSESGNAAHGLGYTLSDFGGAVGVGHSGIGGSLGFCLQTHQVAVGITVSKLSMAQMIGEEDITQKLVRTICTVLAIPIPK